MKSLKRKFEEESNKYYQFKMGMPTVIDIDGAVRLTELEVKRKLSPLISLLVTNKLKPVCDFNPSVDFCLRVKAPERWKSLQKCMNCQIRKALQAVLGEQK